MTTIAERTDPVLDVVERTWGFSSLRPLQRQAIDAAIARRDSLLVVPTGAGKSLCYQAPALMLDGLTVVVSPLIALMKDQVDALTAVGVAAAALNSTTSPAAQRRIEQDIESGALRLLFVSPERLASGAMRSLLKRGVVSAFAIDEAHCISHWGHDFRPEYRQLSELRGLFPTASIHAFTATATARVRADVCSQLRLRDPLILLGDLDRPNLRYRVLARDNEMQQIEEVIRRHRDEAGIVYCMRRRDVDRIAGLLAERGLRVTPYHAGMSPESRRIAQEAFAAEHIDIVVATVAFGMGIDRSNVRFVVHAAMPKSIEHYQQEAGRAGRDGLAAECVLLHSPSDIVNWRRILEHGSDEQLDAAMKQLEAMNRFCIANACRHRALVEHFGGGWTLESCGACDVCLEERAVVDDSKTIVQKILSCVVRVGERFGVRHVAGVLRGERTKQVLSWNHDRLSTYGLLSEYRPEEIRAWIAQLIACGALRQEGHPHPILRLGPSARALLRGEAEVRLVFNGDGVSPEAADEWLGVDRMMFDALRVWRRAVADAKGVAPFVIFGDGTLREIAAVRPSTPERLRQIGGIGDLRMSEYGHALMEIVEEQCEARGLARDATAPSSGAPRHRNEKPSVGREYAQLLLLRGQSVEDVMQQAGRARSTVMLDLCDLIETGRHRADLRRWASQDEEAAIRIAVRDNGHDRLRPIKEIVGDAISYDQIHVVVATIRAEEARFDRTQQSAGAKAAVSW
jgi:ATP-dependent DNA helicase RecQ